MMSSFSRNFIKFRNVSILLLIIFFAVEIYKNQLEWYEFASFLLTMTPHNGKFGKAGCYE